MIFSLDAKGRQGRYALATKAGERYTYAQLCARIREFADAVRSACGPGIAGADSGRALTAEPGGHDRNDQDPDGLRFTADPARRPLIFILCRNSPGAVAGYLGAIEAGAVPLLLDADLEESRLERLCVIYRPMFVWKPATCVPRALRTGMCKDGQQDTVQQGGMLHARQALGGTVYKACGYELMDTGCRPYPVHPDLALLLATSGSTGSPKLVRVTRRNLESNAASIASYLRLTEDERPVTTLPMQYTYGLSIINSHLLSGGCILLTDMSIVQQGFWDFLERERATSLAGVPYTYQMLDRLRFCDRPAGSLRSLTQAGGKLPEALQKKFGSWTADNGVSFYIMYGQTEATARMSYLPPENCLKKIGSIGIPIPGGCFLLSGPAGDPAEDSPGDMTGGSVKEPAGDPDQNPAGDPDTCTWAREESRRFEAIGELVYEGANVTPGYAESAADLLKGDERGGRLYTGDLAGRDADGYYYIIGRKNRFVKLYGVRISLDACEQILKRLYPDCETVCTGTDEGLFVFLTDAQAAVECADRLAEEIRINPRAITAAYMPEIPKNSFGKVQYAALHFSKTDS